MNLPWLAVSGLLGAFGAAWGRILGIGAETEAEVEIGAGVEAGTGAETEGAGRFVCWMPKSRRLTVFLVKLGVVLRCSVIVTYYRGATSPCGRELVANPLSDFYYIIKLVSNQG